MFVLSQQKLKPFLRVVAIVMLALVYYGMAEFSRHVAATPQSVTPVWPPDGLAAAAILIFGRQLLLGVLIGSFLANIWAFFDAHNLYVAIASILQVLGIAIGTTIGAAVGNYLLRLTIRGRNPFRRLDDIYKFLVFTGTLAPMINATAGVVCLCLGGKVSWSLFGSVWLTWWISNVAGICIFTPAIFSWYEFYFKNIKNKDTKKSIKISPWRLTEAIILIAIVISIGVLSFYQEYSLEYVLIPCLVWSVLKFGQFGATNLIVVITMIAVLGTVKGLGSFAVQHANYSLILLQSFIIVIVVTTLSLIAILAEKQQAIANLQKSKVRLIEKSVQLEKSKSNLKEAALVLESQNIALTEAKKNAENANLTKTEFLSNMSHELRTPLNAILGLVQVLQDSHNLDVSEKSDLETVYQSGIHLLNLIDDILDISKIEAGKMELQLQDVNLSKIIKDLVDIAQVQANQKNIDFVYNFSPNLPTLVHTDSKRLRQVLLNLLSNAIKFTNKGHVIFRVYPDEFVRLDEDTINSFILINFELEDSGIGIESDKLESIFLPFEQAGETKFKAQGTGLGLAISQKIAGIMGSKITVSSQLGVGSNFRFTVSLGTPKDNSQNGQNQSTSIVNKSSFDRNLAQKLPLNILLAEDNTFNQLVARKIFNRLGYEIVIADNGLKVLEALQNNIYDVIFMDVQMPELDGIETTKRIINDTCLKQRPYIIALTANAMESDRIRCFSAGMDDYISKPVSVNLLVEALLRSQREKGSA
ncbi:MAG: two-component hybrid sensor and regulator [Pseudanabaena frigida]|uniref:Circadian input-output histidine kinase CikA n=1 Tax=Pseudanabaena frigida TaxID=945775 RepID=A0A2W4W6M0_9CYAN|nr:MAG: two-component hybrid sensor and regulator [Pseudanabaena frigida]